MSDKPEYNYSLVSDTDLLKRKEKIIATMSTGKDLSQAQLDELVALMEEQEVRYTKSRVN